MPNNPLSNFNLFLNDLITFLINFFLSLTLNCHVQYLNNANIKKKVRNISQK